MLLRAHFSVVPLAMVAFAALFGAIGMTELVGMALAADARSLALPRLDRGRAAPEAAERRATLVVAARPPDPPPDVGDAKLCDGLRVDIIAASHEPDYSVAAVASGEQAPVLRRRGGRIDDKVVSFIGRERVWLTSADGALCQIDIHGARLPAPPKATSSRGETPPPGLDPDIRRGIVKTGPYERQIDRGTFDRVLESQSMLMGQTPIAPEMENGKVVGVRLLRVRPGTLLDALGLQTGDRLQTINGYDVTTPTTALEAYARLRTAPHLTLELTREGKPRNLDFDIR